MLRKFFCGAELLLCAVFSSTQCSQCCLARCAVHITLYRTDRPSSYSPEAVRGDTIHGNTDR